MVQKAVAPASLFAPLALSLLPCDLAQANELVQSQISNLDEIYRFLVSDRATQGGALYTATTGPLAGRELPLSFYDTAEYWGAYVCRSPTHSCAVTDIDFHCPSEAWSRKRRR